MTFMSTTATLDRFTCEHGFPTPACCVDCMSEGKFLPAAARKARTGQAAIAGGYALANDCTVQAIVAALGVEYGEAAAALRSAGWVPGKGATRTQVAEAVGSFGFRLQATSHTLDSAARSGGTFIVSGRRNSKGHAWVIESGAAINALGWDQPTRSTMRYVVLEVTA